jgi:hypothetical protein
MHDKLKILVGRMQWNNCLNTNISSYVETSGRQSYTICLNVVHFSPTVLIRHSWQLEILVCLHWCLICVLLLDF